MTSIGYELIVISACVLGGVSLKGGIGKDLLRGGRDPDSGNGRECDEPAEYFAFRAVCRPGRNFAGGGYF